MLIICSNAVVVGNAGSVNRIRNYSKTNTDDRTRIGYIEKKRKNFDGVFLGYAGLQSAEYKVQGSEYWTY